MAGSTPTLHREDNINPNEHAPPTQPKAYRTTRTLYCPDCVASMLLSWTGWDKYTPSFDLGYNAEADLNHIAKAFNLDRTDTSHMMSVGFPVPTNEALGETFCDSCLWWFPN